MKMFVKIKGFHVNPAHIVEVDDIYADKGGKLFYLKFETLNGIKKYSYKNRKDAEKDHKAIVDYKIGEK